MLARLVSYYGWRRVAIIATSDSYGSGLVRTELSSHSPLLSLLRPLFLTLAVGWLRDGGCRDA